MRWSALRRCGHPIDLNPWTGPFLETNVSDVARRHRARAEPTRPERVDQLGELLEDFFRFPRLREPQRKRVQISGGGCSVGGNAGSHVYVSSRVERRFSEGNRY